MFCKTILKVFVKSMENTDDTPKVTRTRTLVRLALKISPTSKSEDEIINLYSFIHQKRNNPSNAITRMSKYTLPNSYVLSMVGENKNESNNTIRILSNVYL